MTIAIKCSELVRALAVNKGHAKFTRLVETAFPTLDGRHFPVGKPHFSDLWISQQNALSLLRGAGPTLSDDPIAAGKVPALMEAIEQLDRTYPDNIKLKASTSKRRSRPS